MSKSFKFKSDEALVGKATDIFEKLGLTLDSAVNLFLTQAILKKGLPFPLVISGDDVPAEEHEHKDEAEEKNVHAEKKAKKPEPEQEPAPHAEEEEQREPTPEEIEERRKIEERVRANEELVRQMRMDEGDDEPAQKTEESEVPTVSSIVNEPAPHEDAPLPASEQPYAEKEEEKAAEEEKNAEESPKAHEEDEDETAPDAMFDSWDDDDEIGCGM